MSLVISPLRGFPLVKPGDDLGKMVLECLQSNALTLRDGDVIVITQKVVSKAENRYEDLRAITPTQAAIDLAQETDKDPRLVEVILRESDEVIRKRKGTIIVQHKLGFICASAGIDHSNLNDEVAGSQDTILLLPEDPNASAAKLREEFEKSSGAHIGVLIIDSQGRAWRFGVVGMTIGMSGIPAIVDERGWTDLFGNVLEITVVGVADELAAAASLMMGQASEGTPVVHVRGFPYPLEDGKFEDLIRTKNVDLFR